MRPFHNLMMSHTWWRHYPYMQLMKSGIWVTKLMCHRTTLSSHVTFTLKVQANSIQVFAIQMIIVVCSSLAWQKELFISPKKLHDLNLKALNFRALLMNYHFIIWAVNRFEFQTSLLFSSTLYYFIILLFSKVKEAKNVRLWKNKFFTFFQDFDVKYLTVSVESTF